MLICLLLTFITLNVLNKDDYNFGYTFDLIFLICTTRLQKLRVLIIISIYLIYFLKFNDIVNHSIKNKIVKRQNRIPI
jgi:hypothetical protein